MSRLLWYPGHELLLNDVVRAENCSLYDSTGKRYVDLESGVWCASIGHGHPRVLRVMAEQSARVTHAGFNYSSHVVEEAAPCSGSRAESASSCAPEATPSSTARAWLRPLPIGPSS